MDIRRSIQSGGDEGPYDKICQAWVGGPPWESHHAVARQPFHQPISRNMFRKTTDKAAGNALRRSGGTGCTCSLFVLHIVPF